MVRLYNQYIKSSFIEKSKILLPKCQNSPKYSQKKAVVIFLEILLPFYYRRKNEKSTATHNRKKFIKNVITSPKFETILKVPEPSWAYHETWTDWDMINPLKGLYAFKGKFDCKCAVFGYKLTFSEKFLSAVYRKDSFSAVILKHNWKNRSVTISSPDIFWNYSYNHRKALRNVL